LIGATTGSARTAALVAAVGFVVLAAFQASLALGAPFGRAAWGGSRTHLPTALRVASAVAVAVWLLAGAIVLGRAGFDLVSLPASALRWGAWILAGVLFVGSLMNVASKSRWERYLWGPLAFALAILCFVVARSPLEPAP
jgi:hypothetical protein